MIPENLLILYKKSAYKIYFMEQKSSLYRSEHLFSPREISDFKHNHERHYRSVETVEKVLNKYNILYQKRARGSKVDFGQYDMVLTVGGDGTFLEAARGLRSQIILGINSDPQNSVGRFCASNAQDFEKILNRLLKDQIKIKHFARIHLNLHDHERRYEVNVLNDILVCHQNPAALSRYSLSVNGVTEEQRSSGLWISTAAGSSGAIYSAGGKILEEESPRVQYKPRELYRGRDRNYKLQGQALILKQPLIISSLMRNGMVFVDGAHLRFPFHFLARLMVSHSKYPLKVVFV